MIESTEVTIAGGEIRSAPRRSAARRCVRLLAFAALVAGFLVAAPGAQSRSSVSLTLYVYFDFTNDISVRLADGTPVGTANGAPTVIPAGYYTLAFEQPGCVQVPLFELQGPGVNIVSNLSGGEVTSATDPANLQPNATYTWRNDYNKSVVYTFTTSSTVLGTQSAQTNVTSGGASKNTTSGNSDIVGSQIVPFRGTLTGSVSAGGKLTLAFKGKSVTSLMPGRYKIAVTDRSLTNGFMLQGSAHKSLSVTGAAFTGKRSGSVDLTAGKWSFAPRGGKIAFSVVVR